MINKLRIKILSLLPCQGIVFALMFLQELACPNIAITTKMIKI